MGIQEIFSSFRGDYLSDKLVRVYSALLFLILAIVIALTVHTDKNMECWAPAYFTTQHGLYTKNTCNRNGDLYIAEDQIPTLSPALTGLMKFDDAPLKAFPYVLAAQALLFLLPWVVWKFLSDYICQLNTTLKVASLSQHTSSLSDVASAISSQVKSLVQPLWPIVGQSGGYFLSITFLLTRLLYWVICFVQLAIISVHFKMGQTFWQPYTDYTRTTIVTEMVGNETEAVIMSANPFPRVVLCDFTIRQMGNIHRHTVQCTMNGSETIENCLIAIKIWVVIVLVILSVSGILQTFRTLFWCLAPRSYKRNFLQQRISGLESNKNSDAVDKFAQEFLKPDVMFLLSMIEEKGSVLGTRTALKHLWEEYVNTVNEDTDIDMTLLC